VGLRFVEVNLEENKSTIFVTLIRFTVSFCWSSLERESISVFSHYACDQSQSCDESVVDKVQQQFRFSLSQLKQPPTTAPAANHLSAPASQQVSVILQIQA